MTAGSAPAILEVKWGEEVVMGWPERIVVDPRVLVGKPVVRNTRLSVEFLVGLLAEGWTEKQILDNYPGLVHEDLLACLQYASEMLRAEKVYPVAV